MRLLTLWLAAFIMSVIKLNIGDTDGKSLH